MDLISNHTNRVPSDLIQLCFTCTHFIVFFFPSSTHPCFSPLRHSAPGPVLVGEDVEDLLLELVGSHVVSVLSRADQVITHLLLLPPV